MMIFADIAAERPISSVKYSDSKLLNTFIVTNVKNVKSHSFWILIAQKMITLADFVRFDMISSVKYFQLWSNTTIWDKFWKPWKKVAFLAQICQEKVDFCRHSSGTTYCFCQIFDIEMI